MNEREWQDWDELNQEYTRAMYLMDEMGIPRINPDTGEEYSLVHRLCWLHGYLDASSSLNALKDKVSQ